MRQEHAVASDEHLPEEHFAIIGDGARVCYEISGSGAPVLLIGGGGSTSLSFANLAPLLSEYFTVINYDRRGTLRSTGEVSLTRYIEQQTDDVVAVLDHAGLASVTVFATCGGTSIAFDLLTRFPDRVHGVIAHEPMTASVLPDALEVYEYYSGWVEKAREIGPLAARAQYHELHKIPYNVALRAQPVERAAFIFDYEVRPMVEYVPDLRSMRNSGSAFVMGVSKENIGSSFAFARTPGYYAKELDAELVVFPGYHAGYFEDPESFAAVLVPGLRKVLSLGEARSRS